MRRSGALIRALSQSEYLWNTAERAGRKPILVKWEMSWPPTVTTGIQVEGTGPGVSNHHQIAGYHLNVAGKWTRRRIGGQRDPETLDPSALQTVRDIDPVQLTDAEMLNLTGDLVGDVVYALRPEFDGAHGKQWPSVRFGMAGQHCTFVMAGPNIKQGVALERQVRAVDVAPTLCYLLGMPMPNNVEGGVVYEALEDMDWHLTA